MLRFRREVYLDNNATTKVSLVVRRKVSNILKNCYGNPSSLYKIARNSAEVLAESRQQVAQAINAHAHEILFTGSATEANNAILKSVSEHFYPRKTKIITTPIEHASVMSTLEFLKTRGIKVVYCPVDNKGFLNRAVLATLLDEDTFLLCCMLANNEIGTIQEITAISQLAKQHQILLMVDCVQALGKVPVDVQALGIDYASFSAHKIHGPKGIGALYIRQNCLFSPFIHGGHQEAGKRAGTESLHNIAGFATACTEIPQLLKKSQQIRDLTHYLVQEIKKIKPDCIINSPENHCLPNTVNITFPKVNNAIFMAMLDYYGISVSAGSACNTQDDAPSFVLKALGLSDTAARETLRFSLTANTSWRDLRYVVKIVSEYFSGHRTPINIITPAQLTENILFDKDTYILDVRDYYDRKLLKGLPHSHEAGFLSIRKYVNQLPQDKNILTVCQMGYNSAIVAYYLKSKHFKNVSFLLTGLVGWKLYHSDLYKKYAGKNIIPLIPE
ncbi:MAG: hypothetical protein BWK79_01450 [Beggiatoa sp. IS2]|nr:MAG: hypothetical protein BWK79_01450 [Beggiatoa sp. IS2]